MLWRKGVGSSRGGGGSVICADMREHCCAERGGVPIGGGLEAFVVDVVTQAPRATPEHNSSRQPLRIYHTDWS